MLALIAASLLFPSAGSAQQGIRDGQWQWHGGDKAHTRYSNLDQITGDNFGKLERAWQWESIDATVRVSRRTRPGPLLATPVMANGLLFASTAFSQVAAIDAGSGKTVWKHDPGSWKAGRPANMGFRHRGVTYWADGDDERIFIGTGHSQLIAINAKSGEPIPEFGDNGHVDLTKGLNKPALIYTHQVNSPPMICRDVVVVGSVILDRPATQDYIRGDIRGFDVRTGEKVWQFRTIPQEGEPGVETWENDSWKYTGNTNCWTLMSADEELGYVYVPLGAATNDFYGGHRLGDNLYANCLVCLNAETGELVWHFQTVHHDLWDFDLPCAPNLVDVVVDGKPIKAVAQMGKTGFCYVFDRITGEPVWPIEERPVPQSTVPGERTAPTQPFPTKPPPFCKQGFTEDDVVDFTPELKEEALAFIRQYELGPLFTPPSVKGTLVVPGDGGGANWMGATFDPETSIIYVPTISYSCVYEMVEPDPTRSDHHYVIKLARSPGIDGIPLFKPPYSRITAIDLKTGTHAWMRPMGDGVKDHPRLKHLNLPPTGGGGWSFPLTTKTLLIAGHGNQLLALDKATGKLLAKVDLTDDEGVAFGRVTGSPLTYMHAGKQYVVVSLTGRRSWIVGFALP